MTTSVLNAKPQRAMAIAAHPDDIEFLMAGTLCLLKERGWEVHYMNLSTGNCGSLQTGPEETRRIRLEEGKNAAMTLGAKFHPPICDDLEILYTVPLLRKVAATVREVAPTVLLVHSLQDYMEDHMIAARLAVTAAFARGMPNFQTDPLREHIGGDVTIYHAMPHGLRDGMRRRVRAGLYVNTESTQMQKRAALAEHRSQKEWLDQSQGMDSYLDAMDKMAQEVGVLSGAFTFAEGWRRHSHLGFCGEHADPLRKALGELCCINSEYEASLEEGR
ncbi:MAG: PIG-L deacetylase family protein [Verrucomicrobiales bacterium]